MKLKYLALFIIFSASAQAQPCVQATLQVQNNTTDTYYVGYSSPDHGVWSQTPGTIAGMGNATISGVNSGALSGFEGSLSIHGDKQGTLVTCNLHIDFPYWDGFLKAGTLHPPDVDCAPNFTVTLTNPGSSCANKSEGEAGTISISIN